MWPLCNQHGMLELVGCLLLVVVNGGTRPKRTDTVGCFVCQSFNGSDPSCEDPFSPAQDSYVPKCQQGMKDRTGTFPASYCVKMAGTSMTTGLLLTVRTCLLVSMHHQCGSFEFESDRYSGCLSTCSQDGCNAAPPTRAVTAHVTWFLPALVTLWMAQRQWGVMDVG